MPTDHSAATNSPSREQLDQALLPLFEAPTEWFQDPPVTYNLTTGGEASIRDLTCHGVMFGLLRDIEHQGRHFKTLSEQFQTADTIDSIAIVDDYQQAQQKNSHSTWITTSSDGSLFWTYEYVPFETPIVTTDDLKSQLRDILNRHPDYDALFDATADVAEKANFPHTSTERP